ncbi:MAG: hypothetical protein ACR2OZ_17225 [Verrucomicrobiales bacterium]
MLEEVGRRKLGAADRLEFCRCLVGQTTVLPGGELLRAAGFAEDRSTEIISGDSLARLFLKFIEDGNRAGEILAAQDASVPSNGSPPTIRRAMALASSISRALWASSPPTVLATILPKAVTLSSVHISAIGGAGGCVGLLESGMKIDAGVTAAS